MGWYSIPRVWPAWVLWATMGLAAAMPASAYQETSQIAAAPQANDEPTSAPLEKILSGEVLPTTVADLRAMQEHVHQLAEEVKQATVGIECQGAQGSGVIVSSDGLVLTAAHVIGQPDVDAIVTLPTGRRLKAVTLGMNHPVDSGMLKITETGDWDYLEMGESGEMRLGQWLMAVGHPGGYQEPRGMVVRIGRLLALTSRVLKTDCTLVGGDSGGPLVDMEGRVVGIHSRIGASLNDNLHVPIDQYLTEWDNLESKEEIGGSRASPWLGFTLKEGALDVTEVTPDSPASEAGMQVGDVIREFDGNPLESREQLMIRFFQLRVGQKIAVGVERNGQKVELTMTVRRRP